MAETFYKKVGRRYVPVREYDSELMDAMPEGAHLVICYPGGRSTRYNVEPTEAPLMAAVRTMSEIITRKIVDLSEMRPERTPLTKSQADAWETFAEAMADGMYYCQYPSAQEITDEVLKYIYDEISRKLKTDAVRQAYEHFELMFKLAGDDNEQ